VTLKRFYPGLGLLSMVCVLVSAASLVGLLFLGNVYGAIVVAALAVVAEMALLQIALRVTRRELRGGGGAA